MTLDRPVAGSLDRIVDPRAVFAIAPVVAGTVDWGDPVTLRFQLPAGVEAREATVALRATGGASQRPLRWFVDGRVHSATRWAIRPGRHRILGADAAGDSVAVSVTVE